MAPRFLLFAFLLISGLAYAQPTGNTPPQDIRASVRGMSREQKMNVLAYIRFLGANLEKEIQHTYEQLDQDKKANVLEYIALQKQDPGIVLPRTSVQWDRDTLRFTAIEEGAVIIDSFTLTNTGFKPYIIREVKTSCDCTVLRYPEFPVLPGETATLRVEFDSRGKAGQALPGIIVYDNSSPNSRNILYLKGEVLPRKLIKKISN